MPTAGAASSSPRGSRDRRHERPRPIGAGDDADSERAGRERGHAEEAFSSEGASDLGQQRGTAEIDEIDHEQFGQAAKQRGVALADRRGGPSSRAWPRRPATQIGPIARPAIETRTVIAAPSSSAGPHPLGPKPSASIQFTRSAPRFQGTHRGVVSILNHLREYFFIEPSAKAAANASLNLAVRSASLLRSPSRPRCRIRRR